MNMWRAGPIVLAGFAIPGREPGVAKAVEQSLDLSGGEATHADVGGAGIRFSVNHPVGVMNVSARHGVINPLRDPVRYRNTA